MPQRKVNWTPEKEELREKLNKVHFRKNGVPEPPPIFRPDAPVIGDAELLKAVQEILGIAPELRGRFSQIREDVTPIAVDKLIRSDLGHLLDGRQNQTNLMGMFGLQDKQIYINPRQPLQEMLETLAHELSHAAGYREQDARKIGPLFRNNLAIFEK